MQDKVLRRSVRIAEKKNGSMGWTEMMVRETRFVDVLALLTVSPIACVSQTTGSVTERVLAVRSTVAYPIPLIDADEYT
jgi:hypothetical protein